MQHSFSDACVESAKACLIEVNLRQALDLLQLLTEEGELIAHLIHPPASGAQISVAASQYACS